MCRHGRNPERLACTRHQAPRAADVGGNGEKGSGSSEASLGRLARGNLKKGAEVMHQEENSTSIRFFLPPVPVPSLVHLPHVTTNCIFPRCEKPVHLAPASGPRHASRKEGKAVPLVSCTSQKPIFPYGQLHKPRPQAYGEAPKCLQTLAIINSFRA